MTSLVRRLGLGFFFSVALAPSACSPKPANSGTDPILAATQRLQGSWRIESFKPESPLEPPLQSLLDAQLGTLTISFSGNQFSAAGPGVNMNGTYKVWTAAIDQLSGTIYDATGVAYRVAGQFDGSAFQFRSFDNPWRGEGRLVR